jgi:homocysteine S-methyltransferase
LKLKDFIKEHILVTDGAMGTFYAQLTGSNHTMSEKANLTHPEIIYDIHKQYIEAGAQLLRTNTFSANRYALDMTGEEVSQVIEKGYTLAKQAVADSHQPIYIAASIGPIAEKNLTEDEIYEEYYFIIDQFLGLDTDVFMFETFSEPKYLKKVIPYLRDKRPNATVIAQFALNLYGYTKKGMSANRLFNELRAIEGLDVFGFNCGIGAGHLYQILRKLGWAEEEVISAIPNSGYPDILQDRMVYIDNVDYFVDTMVDIGKLGVQIVGGCCGTTPSHIKKLAHAIKNISTEDIERKKTLQPVVIQKNVSANEFDEKLKSGKKVIAVELDPPFGKDIDKVMEGANLLKASDIDMITIADSPMGKPRADSLIIASKIRKEVGIPVMPHICCRDKNIIAMKAQILGAYIEGIRNVLLVTGDPIPSSDRNEINSVFNLNSIQLMQMMKEMNIEHFNEEPIHYGGALNPNRANLDKEIERMKKKIDAGATYFLTQPFYDEKSIENIKYIKDKINVKILGGILPLVNIRNARFIQNELPGIQVPDEIVGKFHETMTREESEKVGVEISIKLANKMKEVVDGYYYMVPFNRVHMIQEIIEAVKEVR